MSTSSSDRELWDAFVAAKRELNRRQADFIQNAKNRLEILKGALAEGHWQQATALSYLATCSDDSLELLPQLVDLSLTHTFALTARQAIDRIPRDQLRPLLEPLVSAQLDTADPDDCRRIAELLAHIEAWSLLEQLIHRAQTIDDPDIREPAEDYTDRYGPNSELGVDDFRRALIDAARGGDLSTVEQLLHRVDSALDYALHIAASSGQRQLAAALLAAHRFSEEALEECEGVAWQHDHEDVADIIGWAKIEVD